MDARTQSRLSLPGWWATNVVSGVDRQSVVDQVRSDAGWSSHFAVMTLLSAGIAILGLLLSSPAVVIGAMLISPLMGPIIGLGFAVATFDWDEIRRTAIPLIAGSVLAVLFCAMIVTVSPLQAVTSEISARTRPNLFDLLVALFAGLAGTYAMIRGRHGTIVGVAIATALMPPLAVMGFGLATANWSVLGGSAFLFFTNLMTIAAAAAVLARLYGFATGLSPHQTGLQAALIVLLLVALAIPLGLALHRIAWEAFAGREVSDAIAEAFPDSARVGDFHIDFHAHPVAVNATVFTPKYSVNAARDLPAKLSSLVGRPVDLSLDQIRTADGVDAAIPSAGAAAGAQRSAERLAERVAVVAGVPIGDVLVDQPAKRIVVRAAALPGADLSTYRALESRLVDSAGGWTISLVPPLLPLPDLKMIDGTSDPEDMQTAIWAAQRLRLPIGISGRSAETKGIADQLSASGVTATILAGGGQAKWRWVLPTETAKAN